jgi:hypothetical protein
MELNPEVVMLAFGRQGCQTMLLATSRDKDGG